MGSGAGLGVGNSFKFIRLVQFVKYKQFSNHHMNFSGGQSTQIKYLSKSTDTYNKILLQ